jgi:hypothetical protein
MSMPTGRLLRRLLVSISAVLLNGLESQASAQTLGTFSWQVVPYCNVVYFSVSIDGPSLRLIGYDDQCGAARLPAAGTATLRADGLYGFTFSVMTTTGLVSHVASAINLSSLSGPWSDSSGATGTLVFNPTLPASGNHRPPPRLPGSALASGAITSTHIADGAVGAPQIATGAIGTAEIAAGAVGTSELANASVTGAKIHFPFSALTTTNGYAFQVKNNVGNEVTGAIWAQANEPAGRGVVGTGGFGVTGGTVNGFGVGAYSEGSGTALWAVSYSGPTARFENPAFGNPNDVVTIKSSGTGDFIQASYGNEVRFRLTANGTVQSNGAYLTPAADVAEFIDAADTLAPGDVVEIDEAHEGWFRRATTASSTAVVGVVTTKPGVLLNATDERDDVSQGPALALAGRVPVKVCDENGAIEPGDLLVAASLAGHAMKAPSMPVPGTVIGKALGAHSSSTGLIEMIVMLR